MDCRRNRSVDNPIRCFLSGDVRTNEIVNFKLFYINNCYKKIKISSSKHILK